jgi:hypothetical protein
VAVVDASKSLDLDEVRMDEAPRRGLRASFLNSFDVLGLPVRVSRTLVDLLG